MKEYLKRSKRHIDKTNQDADPWRRQDDTQFLIIQNKKFGCVGKSVISADGMFNFKF